MSAGLTLLSDDELERLRSRIAQLELSGTRDQRMAAAAQLEAIDLEADRRLSVSARQNKTEELL